MSLNKCVNNNRGGGIMELKGVKIGFCITGSFCTFSEVIPQIRKLVEEGAEVFPIFSYSVDTMDTRFFAAKDFKKIVEDITGKSVINTITGAEPIGPKKMLDIVVIAPCTGNTLAKLAMGITDTPVTMATKAHLRNLRPVVIAVSTNDGLGNNGKNIALLMNTKNIYFVPFRQDNPVEKENSIVADMDKIYSTILYALKGQQIQPVLTN